MSNVDTLKPSRLIPIIQEVIEMKNMKDFVSHVDYLVSTVYTEKVKDPVTTSRIFRLHYPFNVFILCVLSVVATFQFSAKAIQCSVDAAIPAAFMNTYCWIQSTYTLPDRLEDKVGLAVLSPGVGNLQTEDEPVKYHKYYQWVVFFLVFQAVLFYIPHYIWNAFENGRIKMLLVPNEKYVAGDIQLSAVTNFLSKNYSNNNVYFRVYIFCEILNLVNVIGQLFLIDMFLGYEFTTYGIRVLQFIDQDTNRTDPMDVVFPKVTKCTFRKFGPTGNVVNYDGLCVLALNIFNEKIFIFLWFWFVILAVITTMGIIWRFITLFSHKVRTLLLRKYVLNFSRHPDLLNLPGYDPVTRLPSYNNPKLQAIRTIMNRLTPGDWFVLYQLNMNMWPHHYKQLIRELALKFGWMEPKIE